jgi:RNA polymerase sigma-70 factor (ECF subfamily)
MLACDLLMSKSGNYSETSPLWRLQTLITSEPAHSAGLEQRITRLFDEIREPLYRYLLSVVNTEAEAEDITQDSFLRLHAQLLNGATVENPKAWLFRVGYNLAIDYRRRKQFDSLDSEQSGTPADYKDDDAPDPERLAIESQRRERIADALHRLSKQQRNCLNLRTEGFRHREIAEILSVSESTVAENLRRAVLRLTKELYGA